MTDNTELAALVGSRICHDLISPVGAINNGLELIGLSGGSSGPELDLIGESVGNANARIRFFRIAFGLSGTDQMIGTGEIFSVLDGLANSSRVQVDWTVQGNVARPELRMAFLAMLCLENTLPFGGILSAARDGDDWTFCAEAQKLKIDRDLWGPLGRNEEITGLTPGQVQFGLLPLVTRDLGRHISVRESETRILLTY